MKEAKFYKEYKNYLQCQLCPNYCIIKENETGKCYARKNIKRKLISLSYGKPVAMNIDPIEKKPLYHFLPGTKTYSIGTAGCTFKCLNCQNQDIAHANPEDFSTKFIEPKEIVKLAIKNNCKSISYTYTEPTAFYEYMLDIAKIAKKNKLKNIIVSNGYINEKPLIELCKYIDAANIDLKSFNEKFYKNVCFGSLKPVLNTLKILKNKNIWLEITNLIIPKLNDNPKEIDKMTKWIYTNLKQIPLHFSKFYPMHKLTNKEPTSLETLKKAYEIAKKNKLNYVYLGNVKTDMENTYCPRCKQLLVERNGYSITKMNIKNKKCNRCNEKIPGIWS
ncbi:MAG: AmmeMemoRadiSam system radical SAM enzyme [Candidatus Nanoarchaeia archaeon]|nr:AmmeMemoRadiSam system radical SAM enzyme [Candidatus Nanoarchaeia archaeon]